MQCRTLLTQKLYTFTSPRNLTTPCPTNRVWKFLSPAGVAEHELDLALRLVSNPHPSRNVLSVALTQNSAAISTENTCPKLYGARTKKQKIANYWA